ncbi:MAG: PHP domain-containing protein [Clostridia bacterium]|nr:PHP domain-containing protein [Clostridia bacterium]
MDYTEKIDLHMHTVFSDGTDTPEEIIARVRESGIGLFSVTDHDGIKAASAIPPLLSEDGPAFITGVEFSCRDGEGKYHVLGYGYDPDALPIRKIVERGHRLRIKKVRARLGFLKTKFGFSFPKKDTDELLSQENPGKPHIANLMVRLGYAASKEQAFADYLNRMKFNSEYVRPEDAIRGIAESGGIPVLAHPCYGDGDQLILGEDMDRRLRRLTDFGLKGVEGFYSGFTPRLCREMLSFAERYGLYVTAGSDYHGKNKMIAPGDTGPVNAADAPEGLRRFLADVKIING